MPACGATTAWIVPWGRCTGGRRHSDRPRAPARRRSPDTRCRRPRSDGVAASPGPANRREPRQPAHATIARMAGDFTRADVERIARLARLELTEHEKDAPHAAAVELPRLRRRGAAGRDRRRTADLAPPRRPSARGATMCRSRRSTGERPWRRRRKPTSNADSSKYHESSRDAASRDCWCDRPRGAIRRNVRGRGLPGGARRASPRPIRRSTPSTPSPAKQALAQAAALDGRRADWDGDAARSACRSRSRTTSARAA